MIRVAFILEGHDWLGGVSYFRNLFSALALIPEPKVHPILFVGTGVPAAILDNFTEVEVRKTTVLDSKTPMGFFRRVVRKVLSQTDLVLGQLLAHHRINVVSHYSGTLPAFTMIKSVGWIPDFQYLHLPAFFPENDRNLREAAVARLIKTCDLILLSSEAAQKDFALVAPQSLPKTRVLRFVPEVDGNTASVMLLHELEEQYAFARPYFHLPNQFWAHKNHATVIEALAILKRRGENVTVIATGSTHDHRFPRHYAQLMSQAKRNGVDRLFRTIGIVPYPHLLSLMHHSVAVINPSLFEGWSTTVEEAKALDKTILLSSLPVHKEQNPRKGVFFDPEDAEGLADRMSAALAEGRIDDSDNGVIRYADSYSSDRLQFALAYQSIIVSLAAR